MKRTVIFDLDGLLSPLRASEFDAALETFNVYKDRGYFMVAFSSRADEVKDAALQVLSDRGLEPDLLCMRGDDETLSANELKQKWVSELGKEKILCVYDVERSSESVWLKEKLPCFQLIQGGKNEKNLNQ